jgi:hypothetical protein
VSSLPPDGLQLRTGPSFGAALFLCGESETDRNVTKLKYDPDVDETVRKLSPFAVDREFPCRVCFAPLPPWLPPGL